MFTEYCRFHVWCELLHPPDPPLQLVVGPAKQGDPAGTVEPLGMFDVFTVCKADMSSTYKKWMLFVDGENLTIRAQEVAKQEGVNLEDTGIFPLYFKDVYFWPAGIRPFDQHWVSRAHAPQAAERSYYYTCTPGDKDAIDKVRDSLWETGFSPVVMHKPKGQRAKGVDIALTKDMLFQAFMGNYEIAVLVAGDGDFVPLVEEVKRLGKRVVVVFWENSGLNPELRRAADEFTPLRLKMS